MPGQVNPERDEPLSLPLDTETVLRALLTVEPSEVVGDGGQDDPGEQQTD